VLKISKFANPNKLLEKFLDAASILWYGGGVIPIYRNVHVEYLQERNVDHLYSYGCH
jgi:hypothetical protein